MTDFELEFSLEPSTELPGCESESSVSPALAGLKPSTSLSFTESSSTDGIEVSSKQTLLQELSDRSVVVPVHLQARVTELEAKGVKTKTALEIAEYEYELKNSITEEKGKCTGVTLTAEQIPMPLWFSLVFAICSLFNYSTLFFTMSLVCRYIFVDGNKLKSGVITNLLKQVIFALIVGVFILRGFDLLSMHGYLPDWLWFYKV